MKFKSSSPKQTQFFAARLAKKITRTFFSRKNEGALILGLVGDLGSGKTTFVQSFAAALNIKRRILSPTFLLMRSYPISKSFYKKVFHVDLYRIKKSSELSPLDFRSILKNRTYIVLIEWADKIKKILPENTIKLEFRHGRTPNERTISIK